MHTAARNPASDCQPSAKYSLRGPPLQRRCLQTSQQPLDITHNSACLPVGIGLVSREPAGLGDRRPEGLLSAVVPLRVTIRQLSSGGGAELQLRMHRSRRCRRCRRCTAHRRRGCAALLPHQPHAAARQRARGATPASSGSAAGAAAVSAALSAAAPSGATAALSAGHRPCSHLSSPSSMPSTSSASPAG